MNSRSVAFAIFVAQHRALISNLKRRWTGLCGLNSVAIMKRVGCNGGSPIRMLAKINANCLVTAWNCGTHLKNGRGYGIRLGTHRDQMIDRSWKTVVLELVGGATIEVEITSGFWKKCPELRHPEIGRWFGQLGLQDWQKGHPHQFTMSALTTGRFRVTYP